MLRSDPLRRMSHQISLRLNRDTTCPLDEALSDMALGKVTNIIPNPLRRMSHQISLRLNRDTTCPLDEALSDMAIGKVTNIIPDPLR